jgi:hypothetical protein
MGALQAVRIDGSVRIPLDSLLEWINGKKKAQ